MSWFDKRLELLRFAYKMSVNEYPVDGRCSIVRGVSALVGFHIGSGPVVLGQCFSVQTSSSKKIAPAIPVDQTCYQTFES